MDPFLMEPITDVDAGGQHSVSCTECQRRKQKCTRRWPCNHCQSRKVPHLCHFATKKSPASSDSGPGGKKRKGREVEELQPVSINQADKVELSAVDDALKALGYLHLGGDPKLSVLWSQCKDDGLVQETEVAIKSIPPRIYCDAIVQNFIDRSNYWYYSIYPPQFLESYNTWWETRTKRLRVSPEFTCLVLRVCACSAQCPLPSLGARLEAELGETVQELTEKFHLAAEKLSHRMKPGTGGVTQVQQLFLMAVWCKSECLFIDSWHALSEAIRQAQEIGMHNENLWEGLSEFDCEIRRRIWCCLFNWDRLMGMMLARPLLINERYCHVKFPQVNLEFDAAYPDMPSPITHMRHQRHLVEEVFPLFDGSNQQVSTGEGLAIVRRAEQWLADLPPIYRAENPDTRLNNSHPWLILQRLQTICMGYSTIISPLKQYLTRTYKSEPNLDAELLQKLQSIAVDNAFKCMDIAQMLYDLFIPDYSKYFLIVFTPFDTAALLCLAIIHDTDRTLPQRSKVLQAIGQGLSLCRRLKIVTKTGSVAESILISLISKFNLASGELPLLGLESVASPAYERPTKKQATEMVEEISPLMSTPSQSTPESNLSPSSTEPIPSYQWHFDPTLSTEFQGMPNFDFGLLEPLWRWDDIDLPLTGLEQFSLAPDDQLLDFAP